MDDGGVTPIESFVKQRRNLLIASLLIIFQYTAQVSFEKKFSILGVGINVDNPHVISTYLVIFFIYFIWRYVTALNNIDWKSKLKNRTGSSLRNEITAEFREYVCRKSGLDPNQFFYNILAARGEKNKFLGYRVDLEGWDQNLSAEKQSLLKSIKKENYSVTGFKFLWLNVKCFVMNALKYSEFGEYIFPLLLAFLAYLEICTIPIVSAPLLFLL